MAAPGESKERKLAAAYTAWLSEIRAADLEQFASSERGVLTAEGA